jgi:uncharacterized membrane protein YphA (DoxX/SURF4 family)
VPSWLCRLWCGAVKDASGRLPLQRLFSTFPGGTPGLGLLLLRAEVGGIATTFGALYLFGLIDRTPAVWIVGALLAGGGIALISGFMTPLASLAVGICMLGINFSWYPAPPLALLGTRIATFAIVITAVAIALLGPGAFSLDGYLFGRREVVIPPRPPTA